MIRNDHILIIFGVVSGAVLAIAVMFSFNLKSGDLLIGIGALANIVLAVLTVVLAWYTRELAIEARATREAASAPEVVVTLEPNRRLIFLDLVVENVGRGVAYDLNVVFEPEIRIMRGGNLRVITGFGNIDRWTLKPNQEYRNFVGRMSDWQEKHIRAIVSYAGNNGKRYSLIYNLDLETFLGMTQLEDDLTSITQSMKKVADAVDRISRGHDHINVNVHDAADREAREALLSAVWRGEQSESDRDLRDQLSMPHTDRSRDVPEGGTHG
jgi:hypothetical protein